jgi:hypothetical protein
MQKFNQELIDGQKEIVAAYERAITTKGYKEANTTFQRTLNGILKIQKQVLQRLGHKPERKATTKTGPQKDLFNKTVESAGETVADVPVLENKNVNKDLFDENKGVEVTEVEELKNDVTNKDLFEPSDDLPKVEAKANPKRLNPTQSKDIQRLAGDGLNTKQISDELMIDQEKVEGHLKRQSKGKTGNLIATSEGKDKTIEDLKYDK